ncbi:NUDIX hydrolase [Schaalia sp. 19OD2882]|uniref:NUDIX hydrolase n=1 Tax=Schaalia sp. 19OD2882 TaxID=2794089 RepID=UPI001C1ECB0F|nr:NUDIX hydrolase [Schaalia sp. 19OD2882]QWW19391.1 NUDIX hydrolase [Schaalia sp. 19OD2882]
MPRTRPAPIPSRLVRAAGALVWRFRDQTRQASVGERIDPADIEVLLVHRPQYHDWSWPKGKAEANEPLVQAAVREVEEETGVAVRLGSPLTTQRYRLGSGQTKEVHYWVGTVLPACLEGEDGPGAIALRTRRPVTTASAREIDQTRWVGTRRADSLLTRRGDRRLLSELTTRAAQGRLVTSTLAVVRHAKAVSRAAWTGDEDTRPLTRLGSRQALDLVDLLSAFGIERAVCSPWLRCTRTLGPWQQLSGARVDVAPELTEDAMVADTAPAVALVHSLLLAGAEPIALCVHRPGIPSLMAPLLARTPSPLRLAYPDASPWLCTAEMLLVHVVHGNGRDEVEVGWVERHGTRTKDVLGQS